MESKKIKSFSSLHPLTLLIYFLAVIAVSMFSTNPVILALSLVGGMLFFAAMADLKVFFKDLGFYIAMFVLITVINPLFSHNGVTPLFFMNGNPVTLEAILYGADIALMLIAVIYWCKCYSMIMTTDKFICLFGKVIPALSLVLSMALRFIPLFKAKLKEIREVQGSLGFYNNKGFINRAFSELKVFSALVSWSLENSVDTSASMKSRGYGLKGRTSFSMYRFRTRDSFFILTVLCFMAVVISGMITGEVDFAFYPEISKLPLNIYTVIVYAVFGFISFLPFLMEVKEEIVWKYSVWKI
jgi:energy-coupling factor transport system permease protein